MNNRIIKFRAWFDGPKLMGDVITLKGSNRTDYDANMWDEVTAECRINGRQQFYSSSNFKLLQSTGLRDKNGKEIWEGDVVKIKDAELVDTIPYGDIEYREVYEDVIGEVIFEDGSFHYTGHSAGHLPAFSFNTEVEVIGNLYEHPHLLNQEK